MMHSHGFDADQLLEALGPAPGPLALIHQPPTDTLVDSLIELSVREDIHHEVLDGWLMEAAYNALLRIRWIGPHVAYQTVCDMNQAGCTKYIDDATWAASTSSACQGASQFLGDELVMDRKADRDTVLKLMRTLRPVEWRMSEVHRALCLFGNWVRDRKPVRRYRWR